MPGSGGSSWYCVLLPVFACKPSDSEKTCEYEIIAAFRWASTSCVDLYNDCMHLNLIYHMGKTRLLHLVIMLMAVLACSRTSAAGFESDVVSCVGISRAEYDEAKLCAAKGANVEIQPADISRELLAVMLEKVAALDLSLYKACSGNVLSSFEDGRYVDDGEFIIESKCVRIIRGFSFCRLKHLSMHIPISFSWMRTTNGICRQLKSQAAL